MQKSPGFSPIGHTWALPGLCWFVLSHPYLWCGMKVAEMQKRENLVPDGEWWQKCRKEPCPGVGKSNET